MKLATNSTRTRSPAVICTFVIYSLGAGPRIINVGTNNYIFIARNATIQNIATT